MSNPFFSYDNQLIPGQLARAEAVANDFILVQTGFSLLVTQGVDAGVVNAYVVTTPGQPTVAYADGNTVEFKPLVGNTGASTVNVNSVGVIPILRFNGAALLTGDLLANVWTTLTYNVAFNAFTITGPGQNVVVAGSISAAAPTHKVGLVAAAGVATSVAPIDATYAIDQGIAPTWTGVHTFSATPVMNAGLTVGAGTSAIQALTATTGVFASTLSAAGITSSAGLTVNGSAITSSAGLTVSAGTSAVQALTATTGVFASTLSAAGITSSAGLTVSAGGATVTAGSVVVGVPTGGGQGTGTVNAAGLFVNGVAVSLSGATVTSIAGTANQITASASTGAVTLSLPSAVVFPGTISLNGQAGGNLKILPVGSGAVAQSVIQYFTDNNLYIDAPITGTPAGGQTIFRQDGGTSALTIKIDGGVVLAAATGSSQGLGTLNCTGLFVNGVAVAAGATTTGSFTVTYTGMASATTGTAQYAIAGKVCSLTLPVATNTSNATSFTMTGLPAAIQPARAQIVGCAYFATTDAGIAGANGVDFSFAAASGTITMLKVGSTAGWTGTNIKGISTAVTVTYMLN